MLKFLVFSDLHYKKMMYAASVQDLKKILQRAALEKVDFIVHGGDLCNDYIGSPELIRTLMDNEYDLPVYGVFGNHELESENNSLDVVKTMLSNREITYGAQGGAYWHKDVGAYRLIGLDTNFSYSESLGDWEHNHTASWGAPAGNRYSDSLGPDQLAWLEKTVADAAQKGLKAVVVSHAGLSGSWKGISHAAKKEVVQASPDAAKIRDIFAKYGGTVLLSINGHYHTDHFAVNDGIAYFDVNTVQNGCWELRDDLHYAPEHTFTFTDYDGDGKELETRQVALNELVQAGNTWFFDEPLSAVVTIDDDGTLTIEGSKTSWRYDVLPDRPYDGMKPEIPSHTVKLW